MSSPRVCIYIGIRCVLEQLRVRTILSRNYKKGRVNKAIMGWIWAAHSRKWKLWLALTINWKVKMRWKGAWSWFWLNLRNKEGCCAAMVERRRRLTIWSLQEVEKAGRSPDLEDEDFIKERKRKTEEQPDIGRLQGRCTAIVGFGWSRRWRNLNDEIEKKEKPWPLSMLL